MSNKIVLFLFPIIFSLLLSVPIILPYFHNGYFPTHDGEWAVVRLGDMFRTLRDGQFPARYSGFLNFGYGYPLFNFAYPFPYYAGVVIHFLKFSFVDSIKILFMISVFLSAYCMFLASHAVWNNKWSAVISAGLYLYLPYRIVDLFVRGSIGESISFALFPLIIFCMTKIAKEENKKIFHALLICSLAFLIGTHNIMATLFLPVIGIFIVFFTSVFSNKKLLLLYISCLIWGILLASFFWMPALFEKNNIALSKIPIADRNLYFTTIEQLVIPQWGYGVPTERNGFSYQLGIGHIGILLFAIFYVLFRYLFKRNIKKEEGLLFFIIGLIVVMILLMFSFSSFVWKLPLLKEINYPWTLLAPIGFLISLLSGFLAKIKYGVAVGLLCVVISIFLVLPYAKPEVYTNKGDSYYLTIPATTTSSDELMPIWVKRKPLSLFSNKVEIENSKVDSIIFNSKKISFAANPSKNSLVTINTIYYPGWKLYIDGTEKSISYNNDFGLITTFVTEGRHSILLQFTETPLRMFANSLSFISLVSLVFYFIWKLNWFNLFWSKK